MEKERVGVRAGRNGGPAAQGDSLCVYGVRKGNQSSGGVRVSGPKRLPEHIHDVKCCGCMCVYVCMCMGFYYFCEV